MVLLLNVLTPDESQHFIYYYFYITFVIPYRFVLQDLWFGINNLNTQLVIGFRKQQNTCLAVFFVVLVVSVCSEDLQLWMTML